MDRDRRVTSALRALQGHYGPLSASPVYETEAVGFEGDPFYNLVVAFEAAEPPRTLRESLHAIERAHGRERPSIRFAPRALDLDLLLY
ncbi:MAG: 2-amino-4-hydroxy-6-hydroxymethyldihydropteridine diphosphokinase, partial [Gammaproteobacteria bacterium]|nr:2-amino-4-hydroxy-6-hydroxymethyldihydropteridine diphosphokinase [Gammaproteobacteria bacterium]